MQTFLRIVRKFKSIKNKTERKNKKIKNLYYETYI